MQMTTHLVRFFGTSILEYVQQSCEEAEEQKRSCVDKEALSRLEELFFQHLLQIWVNAHMVTCVSAMEEEPGAADGRSRLMERVAETQLGRVLLPTASLINHSCLPNAFFR